MNILDRIRERAKKNPQKIILPEGNDARILRAAEQAAEEGIADVVVLGAESVLRSSLKKVKLVDHSKSKDLSRYARAFCERRGSSDLSGAEELMRDPLFFAAAMVSGGDADAMVAGASHTTTEVARSALRGIGVEKEIKLMSGSFLMVVSRGKNKGGYIFADCAIIPEPTPEQLARIALSSGRTCRLLLECEPRVAFLSYSTRKSAAGNKPARMIEANRIFQTMADGVTSDGELQLDAAVVPEVAMRKSPDSPLQGRANVLIFPDLNAGNIAYKLLQRLGGAEAVGPILQGLTRSVCDLSRGCSVEDIVNAIAVSVVRAKRRPLA